MIEKGFMISINLRFICAGKLQIYQDRKFFKAFTTIFDSFRINCYSFGTQGKGTMGIKCPKCHFDNPSDSKYCKECATLLSLRGNSCCQNFKNTQIGIGENP